ncbi:hypothetical protein BC826DRAFT_987417 [Russula brevipes]|nr:hypothetical protein BC826DRAFT_987417 [Russula brevipes]
MRGPMSRPSSSKSSKDVNNLLHTLRGEHFRHTLNTQRTTGLGAAPRSTPQSVGPSLPYAEIYGLQPHRSSSRALDVDVKVTSRTTAAGPIPRSWAAAATTPATVSEGPVWRTTALSLFFTQSDDGSNDDSASAAGSPPSGRHRATGMLGPRPTLAECCLRVLLEYCGTEADVLGELAPHLAPHHRKLAVRMCAVHSPLSDAALRALLDGGEGGNHVDGELIVDEAEEGGSGAETLGLWDDAEAGESGWQGEEEEEEEEQSLTAVAIVSTTLSVPALLALPPSLTRLALVHLSAPIPVHRLPDKCPLLEFLDISYNPWLAEPAWGGERALERVAWGRWAYLKVLGCRGCGVTSEELEKVNEGRWEDVTIVT